MDPQQRIMLEVGRKIGLWVSLSLSKKPSAPAFARRCGEGFVFYINHAVYDSARGSEVVMKLGRRSIIPRHANTHTHTLGRTSASDIE